MLEIASVLVVTLTSDWNYVNVNIKALHLQIIVIQVIYLAKSIE